MTTKPQYIIRKGGRVGGQDVIAFAIEDARDALRYATPGTQIRTSDGRVLWTEDDFAHGGDGEAHADPAHFAATVAKRMPATARRGPYVSLNERGEITGHETIEAAAEHALKYTSRTVEVRLGEGKHSTACLFRFGGRAEKHDGHSESDHFDYLVRIMQEREELDQLRRENAMLRSDRSNGR